jgi:tetratricopeptide (TPR) repeat protein
MLSYSLRNIQDTSFGYVIFIIILHFNSFFSIAQVGVTSFNKGNDFYAQEKYKEAINLFTQAIDSMESTNPKPVAMLVKTYNNRGNAYGQSNNLLLALFDYDKAVALDNKLIESYLNRANVQTILSNFAKAIADLNKVIQLSPTTYEAYYQRGLILLLDIRQYADAAKDLKLASEKITSTPSPTAYYAQCLLELQQLPLALTQANKALTIDKNYADGYYIRALIYRALKDKPKATADIDTALKLSPNTPEYKKLKGELK